MMRSRIAKLIAVAIIVGLVAELLRRLSEQELAIGEPGPPAAAPESPTGTAPSGAAPGGASRAELYAEAKRRGIPGRSRMSKAELEQALSEGT
jgi:hypothetical protein